ncbi:MAG: hypothetical protein KME16_13490 [Scytolyngbya sp. HA4215-MV1]|nr:hypothetical protein [Scytolyngbya sp. HA4215-MV1]
MSSSSAFLRSLLLTSFVSFATPVLLVGGAIVTLMLVGCLPLLDSLSQLCLEQLLKFLTTFGSGSALQGVLVIGCTCALVGALFDAYAFYRYQNFRGD